MKQRKLVLVEDDGTGCDACMYSYSGDQEDNMCPGEEDAGIAYMDCNTGGKFKVWVLQPVEGGS